MSGRSYSAAVQRLRQRQAARGPHREAGPPVRRDWASVHRAARIEQRIAAVREDNIRRMEAHRRLGGGR